MKINPLLLTHYKECATCDKKMAGIMDYAIRIICSGCGGHHIPYVETKTKTKKGARK